MTFRLTLAMLVLASGPAFAQDAEVKVLLSDAKAPAAAAAVKKLAAEGEKALVPILDGMKGAKPVAANWLRAAFEATASGLAKSGKPLPKSLVDYIKDTDKDPAARRLAYDWMLKTDKSLSSELIPKMLFDPAPEFRRDAIAQLILEGERQLEAGAKDAAKKTFETALSATIHDDQVRKIVKPLKELGIEVDLKKHFGFLTSWSIIGPFNNKDGVGFAEVYPPEKTLDLKAEVEGQFGNVTWKKFTSDDDYGALNIGKLIKNYKGSCMYATTEFQSDRDQTLQFRLATPNAWKLWVNDKFVFGREEYHRTPSSLKMDVYSVPVKLKAGANRILLKVCQNEQEQNWAQRYQFNVRVCDETGTAVKPAVARKSASAK